MSSEGFVYYMQCADTLRIKIGWSADPERRLAEITAGGPTLVELLAVEPGGRAIERARHEQFWPARVEHIQSREWFYPVEPLIDLIAHLGCEARTGPVVPGVVLAEMRGRSRELYLEEKLRRVHDAAGELEREWSYGEITEIEGLVQDLLLIYHENVWLVKGYRHGYRKLSRVLMSNIRFLREWLKPAVDRVRRHGPQDPHHVERDPERILPERCA